MTAADVRCAHCHTPTVMRVTYHRDNDGALWRVPVHLCPNPSCLEARGAIRTNTVPVGGVIEWGSYRAALKGTP